MRDEPQIGAEIGGYRLESLISRGGMGVVYLAEDARMGRTVALKVLPTELGENDRFRARFLHESRVAGAVNHPNVIPVYDAGESDGLLYISMRYVEGTDLRGLLRTAGPLELQRAVSIVSQSASALAATHERGLIHRDVKPGNILLVPRTSDDGVDHVYLTDFGLAKNLGSLSGLTKSGQFMGTVGYVAPEQIRGHGVDRRTDVYALGCVLFECLTGVQPFKRKDDFATIMAHVNDAPPLVSDLRPGTPAAIDEVVGRALAKDAEDRFAGCDELGAALRRAAGSPTGITSSPPAPPELTPPAQASVWFDAETEKQPVPRETPAVDPTEAVWLGGGGDASGAADATAWEDGADATAWEELEADADATAWEGFEAGAGAGAQAAPPPPPPPRASGSRSERPPAPSAASTEGPAQPPPARRDAPPVVRLLLALVALGSIVALAIVLLGGGDDDSTLAAPAAAPPAAAGPAPDSAWRPVTGSPTARQQVATAVLDGKISLIGGLVGSTSASPTSQVESYDPAIDTWNTAPALPRPLHHATAVGYRGELVVMGGWEAEGSNLTAKTSGEVLALRNGDWVKLAPLRHPRAAAAAVVVDDEIIVVGGQGSGKLVPATEIFDGKRWRDAAPLPTPREHLAAATDGRFVYAVGGRNRSSDRNTGALERYDPVADRWRKLPDMPVASGSLGAAILGGRLVAVGGEDSTKVIKNVQSYDLRGARWTQLDAMRTPRHGLGVAAFNTTIYALDGARATGHLQSTNVAEALDLG